MNRNMEHFSTAFAVVSAVTLLYFSHSLYSSHASFTTSTVFDSRRALPRSVYLMIRFIHQSLKKKRGHMRQNKEHELVFALINCRYEVMSLRRFCSVGGYGWDYPDSVFRDIPLCYPEILFRRLITMIVCSEKFKLSPRGLLSVGETVHLSDAVDELKRGAFCLQARVMEYRTVRTGVEVDLYLSASRDQQIIWNSTLTLLSPNSTHTPDAYSDTDITHDLSSPRCIQLSVPWTTSVRCARVFGDLCPLSASLFGFTLPTAPSLWMFSRCIAEIEKHKGAEAIRAPLTVSVRYVKPLSLPNQVTIRISEHKDAEVLTTATFSLEDHRTGSMYISGQIQRHSHEKT
ncbi:hypothetical protein E1301_Tti022373 [Triplophysa tibetana]|uniref:Thioesterase domain-containing protein n=1 Tax=Triplophysa tibetana TaxID=1572043 RepID=A0A5A9P636_9TELE|nr:hypothetical protein E1301_Tti022373 [Triplophysa tibetana]